MLGTFQFFNLTWKECTDIIHVRDFWCGLPGLNFYPFLNFKKLRIDIAIGRVGVYFTQSLNLSGLFLFKYFSPV